MKVCNVVHPHCVKEKERVRGSRLNEMRGLMKTAEIRPDALKVHYASTNKFAAQK